MIKREIKYEDYNGNQKTKIAYFNLNKVELIEMELSKEGGLSNYYQQIVDAKNNQELARIFKELIIKSYGIKSEDGESFVKVASDGHALADDFVNSAAFEAFYMELITDTDKATAFFNGIVPKINTAVPAPGDK